LWDFHCVGKAVINNPSPFDMGALTAQGTGSGAMQAHRLGCSGSGAGRHTSSGAEQANRLGCCGLGAGKHTGSDAGQTHRLRCSGSGAVQAYWLRCSASTQAQVQCRHTGSGGPSLPQSKCVGPQQTKGPTLRLVCLCITIAGPPPYTHVHTH